MLSKPLTNGRVPFVSSFFLKGLERCEEKPEELGFIFKKYERKLHMYVVYCQNKPVSEFIVSEKENYFEVICTPESNCCIV
jgi:hypothetical protein